jgi:beta-xylosidase
MKRIGIAILLAGLLAAGAASGSQTPAPAAPVKGEIRVILAGDFPDPTIVRVGRDFYMTHSSNRVLPGLVIWHSTDLVSWQRIGAALRKPVGDVWAPDIVYFKNKFYLYFPAAKTNWVVTADRPEGPWSEPVDLKLTGIDPGHVATSDGKRYLFVDGGRAVKLAPDGLSVVGVPRPYYDGWKFPEDWVVEGFYAESPKLTFAKGYYFLTTAQGGTSGPSTSHMVVSARSKSPLGPWKNSPLNPIVKTWSRAEKYWSKGHGTIFDDADGRWYIVYHAYENGFLPLGRSTLIEPVEWTKDGWFKTVRDSKAEGPVYRLRNSAVESDDFAGAALKLQWQFSGPGAFESCALKDGRLVLQGGAADVRALLVPVGDHSYEATVRLEIEGDADTGLVAFYNAKMFAGIGLRKGSVEGLSKGAAFGPRIKAPSVKYLKLKMTEFDLQMFYGDNGKSWKPFPNSTEVSGYHHNVLGSFGSLKLGVYVKGPGSVKVGEFTYKSLD